VLWAAAQTGLEPASARTGPVQVQVQAQIGRRHDLPAAPTAHRLAQERVRASALVQPRVPLRPPSAA